MNKVKVKIIKTSYYIYDDYEQMSAIYPMTIDWEEVTVAERNEIAEAVAYANAQNKNRDFHYVLIEYHDSCREEVFTLASQFKEKMKREKELEEQKKAEAKRKREEKALERKRKQLEKLKKELGDD